MSAPTIDKSRKTKKGSFELSACSRRQSLLTNELPSNMSETVVHRPGEKIANKLELRSINGNERRLIMINGSISKPVRAPEIDVLWDSHRQVGWSPSASDDVSNLKAIANVMLGATERKKYFRFLRLSFDLENNAKRNTLPAANPKLAKWLRYVAKRIKETIAARLRLTLSRHRKQIAFRRTNKIIPTLKL